MANRSTPFSPNGNLYPKGIDTANGFRTSRVVQKVESSGEEIPQYNIRINHNLVDKRPIGSSGQSDRVFPKVSGLFGKVKTYATEEWDFLIFLGCAVYLGGKIGGVIANHIPPPTTTFLF